MGKVKSGQSGQAEPVANRAAPQRSHNQDRMRRARSWLKKSRQKDITNHEKFIFLWIAFNAAYGAEAIGAEATEDRVPEAKRFKKFLQEIVQRDTNGAIGKILWKTFSGPIRNLLNNQYVFRPFWEHVQGTKKAAEWEGEFDSYNRRVNRALGRNINHIILTEIFYRLYTMRNQVFHGGTTFAEGWGQPQLRDGSRIMASLVPAILKIMQAEIRQNPDTKIWGKVAYPRINQSPDK